MSETITAVEYQAEVATKKPSKYRNKQAERDGITFHSQAEARRYDELQLLLKAGAISDLMLQPRYPIAVNSVKICTYVADFRYFDHATDEVVIEDVKGAATDTYKIKEKLMLAVYGIAVRRVRA